MYFYMFMSLGKPFYGLLSSAGLIIPTLRPGDREHLPRVGDRRVDLPQVRVEDAEGPVVASGREPRTGAESHGVHPATRRRLRARVHQRVILCLLWNESLAAAPFNRQSRTDEDMRSCTRGLLSCLQRPTLLLSLRGASPRLCSYIAIRFTPLDDFKANQERKLAKAASF